MKNIAILAILMATAGAASAASVDYTAVTIPGESTWVQAIVLTSDTGEHQIVTTDAALKGRTPLGDVTVASDLDMSTPAKVAQWANEHPQASATHYYIPMNSYGDHTLGHHDS